MQVAMIGRLPLSSVQNLRDNLEQNLAGEDGEVWLEALETFLQKENPWPASSEEKILSLQTAPKNTYKGVRNDGDPYKFLLEVYGIWLQPGRKCLDRPLLKGLDAKLLKALQQRATRNPGEMPALSEVFPGISLARENRLKFGV